MTKRKTKRTLDAPHPAEIKRREHLVTRAAVYLDVAANAILKAKIHADETIPTSANAKAIRERLRRLGNEAFALAIDIYEVTK